MKFTCIPQLGKSGGGIQWDKETNKVLARFDAKGEFETDDETVALKLIDLGYKSLDDPAPKPQKNKRGG